MARLAVLLLALAGCASAAGCAAAASDGTGTSEGAATAAIAAPAANAQPTLAGNYGGRMHGEWDGSLSISNALPATFDFAFEISPDLDVAPIGRLNGTAKAKGDHYRYDDGSCTIDFQPVTGESGARRGDLFVNASISCAIMLGLDGHSSSSTALDFTATWRRL